MSDSVGRSGDLSPAADGDVTMGTGGGGLLERTLTPDLLEA